MDLWCLLAVEFARFGVFWAVKLTSTGAISFGVSRLWSLLALELFLLQFSANFRPSSVHYSSSEVFWR